MKSELDFEHFDMIENNYLHLMDPLFDANEKKNIEIKNCWAKVDLAFQKDIIDLPKNFFITFKR